MYQRNISKLIIMISFEECTCRREGGKLLLMVHTIGDIALSRNKILDLIVLQVPHIHVLMASNIMAEVLSSFHGKSTFFIIVIW